MRASLGDARLEVLASSAQRLEAYLEQHNADPTPFVWTDPAADILNKVARGRQVLESVR